ncbi:MFS transporter [Paenibacillus sp. MMS20-IR301]|uniref:MFS transporter n=1 Tax=Paenibacillus sp. MMS20-IR301 TaxID=2895946 RepID=UPI0028E18827|nr:MFS transporter [Paenibacillus sp. MMS20-IR301]WNS45672.1 MFS transporter [Paenibacillus sp. MMS20-IR301]
MLSNKYVRTIIMSRVLLQLGVWVRNFAILLYVTEITGNDPFYVSLISVAEYAPVFLFAIVGGTFADRWLPKRTMMISDMLSACSVFVVLLVVLSGSWRALLLATLLSAILSQFSQPSAMKLFKQHVPEEQLQSVMAMFQSLSAFFMVIGPVIGAFIYGHYGIEVSLAVMGGMFIGSALILSRLPGDAPDEAGTIRGSVMAEMKSGLSYVRNSPVLRNLGAAFAFAGLAAGLIQPLGVFVIIENLGRESGFLQWVMMANGAAMLLGGVLIMSKGKAVKPQTLLALGLLVSAAGTVAVGWSHQAGLTILLQALTGFFYPCIHIGINTLILRNTEAAYMGRVGGIMGPVFMGFMVIGMSTAGYLKGMFSLSALFTASGVLFLIGMLLLLPLVLREEPGRHMRNQV